jgi:short-subunit dehydrogenase
VWKQFTDKWALVTGASSGIGAEFARQLAARGMHLVLVARRKDLLDALAEELHAKHATRCEAVAVDLSQPHAVSELLAELHRRDVTVDLLVNNAGFGIVGEVDDADVDRLLEMLRLNVSAAVELTYRLLPGMLQRGQGAIVNVSSLSAFQPVAYMGVYAATKTFLLHFSEALAEEIRSRSVTVLAVCPGVTKTAFFDAAGAPGWLQKHRSHSPERVVRSALAALERRRQVIVIGWRNFLLTVIVRLFPRRRVVKESTRFFRPRRKDGAKDAKGGVP